MENCMEIENNSDSDYEDVNDQCQTDFEDDEFDEIIPLKDDAKFVLKGHTNVVLSVVCDSKSTLIFTGSMDDNILVWNMETGQQLSLLSRHSDSVTHLALNQTDSFLVSGDLQGLINIWKISRNPFKITLIQSLELSSEIIDTKFQFCPTANEEYLHICDITGTVQSFAISSIDTENGAADFHPSFYHQGKGCSCSGFSTILNSSCAVVLYGGTCRQHEDCGNTNSLDFFPLSYTGQCKELKVDLNTVANEDEDDDEGLGAGFASGRWNNCEMLAIGDWSQLIIATIVGSAAGVNCKLQKVAVKDGGLVTNVAFSGVLPYIAFATKLGVVGVYDVQHNRMRFQWQYEAAVQGQLQEVGAAAEDDYKEPVTVSTLRWHHSRPSFFTTGTEGRLCCWDARVAPSGDVPCWWGHSSIVWGCCVAADGKSVVTVSEDRTGRVFQI